MTDFERGAEAFKALAIKHFENKAVEAVERDDLRRPQLVAAIGRTCAEEIRQVPLPVQPPGSESREARLEKALRECLTEAENQFQWAQATHCDDCDPGDEGREVWADILGSINRALAPPARPPSPEKQQGFASDQPASGYGGGEFNRPPPEKQRGDKT